MGLTLIEPYHTGSFDINSGHIGIQILHEVRTLNYENADRVGMGGLNSKNPCMVWEYNTFSFLSTYPHFGIMKILFSKDILARYTGIPSYSKKLTKKK